MRPFNRPTVVPVLRLSGPIGIATPLRPGLTLGVIAAALDKAFSLSKIPAVAVLVNSPGGSPVQSSLIFKRLRHLAEEKRKKIYVFCEDVAASGGYYIAVAGDEIYADPSSIIGSIGVISQGFGFVRAIDKLGIERRVYTSGKSKSQLDPFMPENSDDIQRLKDIQRDVHDVFIGVVKERRLAKLKGPDGDLFTGAFWAGPKAAELGLIDGISDVRSKMQELYGPDVKLQVVETQKGALLSRFRRSAAASRYFDGDLAFAGDLVSAIEARALWSRYGL